MKQRTVLPLDIAVILALLCAAAIIDNDDVRIALMLVVLVIAVAALIRDRCAGRLP